MTEDQLQPDAAASPEIPPKTGADVIAGYLKMLPQSPGVYSMLDVAGDVI
jgi:excinuclease ABC subunit C